MQESRTEIAERHAREWETYRLEILGPSMRGGDEKEVKAAKTLADAIRITQDGERRAWNFAEGGAVDGGMEIVWGDESGAAPAQQAGAGPR